MSFPQNFATFCGLLHCSSAMRVAFDASTSNTHCMQPTRATFAEATLCLNRPKLDELRRAHGIKSEAELARRIGVDTATLWRVSNGQTPGATFIARLMVAFPAARMDDLFSVINPAAKAS